MRSAAAAIVVQRQWRRHMVRMMMHIRAWSREMTRCAVCHDECVTLFRCDNGHGCCVGCDASIADQRCPLCREPRHANADDTLRTLLFATRARHLCTACNILVDTRDCERHRAWCPSHAFACPVGSCQHACAASQLARHVRQHELVARDIAPGEFVLVANRYSEDAILIVDADVIVVSTAARTHNTLNDIVSGGIRLGIRCYYGDPTAGAWACTVRQIQVSTSQLASHHLEEYRLGVVPPMIASRENVIVAPYTPHIIPQCIDTSPGGLRTPLVLAETGRDLVRRLTTHGIRDVPWVTKPTKDITLGGPPACVLRVRLERLATHVNAMFVD